MANPWIRYVDRSYQQIKESVLTRMHSSVPEITDHSESNLFVRMVSIWAGLAEMLGYYIDNAARETFLSTARLYKSVVHMAEFFNYRIHSFQPASVNLTFTLNAPIGTNVTIPINTRVTALDGSLSFVTIESVIILAGEENVTVSASQVTRVSGVSLGTTQGLPNETFILPSDVADMTALVKINNIAWAIQETLAYSGAVDEHYTMSVDENGQIIARFGNGANGKILPAGQSVVLDYDQTKGLEGNVPALTIDTIPIPISAPTGTTVTVKNLEKASGGMGIEDIETLKRKIPLSIRTKWRAVTRQDYIDVAELYHGVSKAGVVYTGGKTVTMYIVPADGGVASDLLRGAVEAYMMERVMITTDVEVFAAGEVVIKHEIDIAVLPGYSRIATTEKVKENLSIFLSYLNQDIEGRVEIGDVYQIIENTEGVEYSRLQKMYTIPYARPENSSTIALDWERQTLVGSNIATKWRIMVLSGTDYELYRGSVFVGAYTFGVQYSLPDFEFKVNAGAYNTNDSWEFVTYPYSDNIDLIEPSIPVSKISDITINATGGIG